MPRVVHFEISADDPDRAIAFYEKVFGWKVQKWEGPMEYWVVSTGVVDEPGIDGAIMRREPNIDNTNNTIDVPDIDEYVEKDAIEFLARSEAILMGPVYTGRAMGALIDLIGRGEIDSGERVLFWHTGDTPTLFAYSKELLLQIVDQGQGKHPAFRPGACYSTPGPCSPQRLR